MTTEQTERIRAALRAAPTRMTLQLSRQLGVPEVEVIRAMREGRAVELDAARWEEILRALEEVGNVHVIVTNGAVTCETTGRFGGFSVWGEFFNVQSGSLDLHVRFKELTAAFAVEKPGHTDGVSTLRVQFYDRQGAAALKAFLSFGGAPPAPERRRWFDDLRRRFAKG